VGRLKSGCAQSKDGRIKERAEITDSIEQLDFQEEEFNARITDELKQAAVARRVQKLDPCSELIRVTTRPAMPARQLLPETHASER
jgi:hypothetical protein